MSVSERKIKQLEQEKQQMLDDLAAMQNVLAAVLFMGGKNIDIPLYVMQITTRSAITAEPSEDGLSIEVRLLDSPKEEVNKIEQ